MIKVFMAIGIAIVYVIFVGYGLHVIYEPPSYSDFEKDHQVYEDARKTHTLNSFFILEIIGISTIVVGALLFAFTKLDGVDAGLIAGGILTIIYSIVISWEVSSKYMRLFILFMILLLLFFLAYFINYASNHRGIRKKIKP